MHVTHRIRCTHTPVSQCNHWMGNKISCLLLFVMDFHMAGLLTGPYWTWYILISWVTNYSLILKPNFIVNL